MTEPPTGAVADGGPRRRLSAALRPLITMAVATTFDDDALNAAAERLEEVHRLLAVAAGPKRSRVHPDVSQHAQEFFPSSPIMGMDNPIAPPVIVQVVEGVDGGYPEIRAEAWFDWAYEGPPTCVHGGVIAATFDELLGAATIVSGNPSMTGTLTVRYRKPTPLRTPLRIVAKCVGRHGRKVKAWGGIYDGDVLTAEADGLFIEVGQAQFLSIAVGNVDSADPGVMDAMRAEAARVDAASDVHWNGPAPDPETPPAR